MRYPKLFDPCYISKLELANRVILVPLTTHLSHDGFVTDRMMNWYGEIGRGGSSLVIVEDSIVEAPRGRHTPNDLLINDDRYIPGLHRLAEAIKKGGARACIQISHAGRNAGRLVDGAMACTGGIQPVAPSPIAMPVPGWTVPRELTIEEIRDIEDKYADAAVRAAEAGFEVISLHGAHTYLINQFLSPLSNHRQDEYGGSFNGRVRFFLEIIRKIKQRLGNDFPLMCRLSGNDILPGGQTIEDIMQVARRIEAAGMHCISVSAVMSPVPLSQLDYIPLSPISPMRCKRGELVHLANAVKDAVSIPVVASNRIMTPQFAEQILQQSKADIIGLGRGLLADPEWPRKAQEGREKEIRHCICCMHCTKITRSNSPIGCAINPRAGREGETEIGLAPKPRTVFVAGGGPAGLEAARVAALRGHKVRLYEKDKLGGQLNLACVPPGKADIMLLLDFELEQLNKLGVQIEYKELTPEIVSQEKPDAVVVATGVTPVRRQLPGGDNGNVSTAREVLQGELPRGKVVVVVGGKQMGAETAEFLGTKGYDVTIVESTDILARDIVDRFRDYLLVSLKSLGVKTLTEATVEKTSKDGVIVVRKGDRQFIKADSVVLAFDDEPNRELADQLKELGVESYPIGDCTGSGKVLKAVTQGFRMGCSI